MLFESMRFCQWCLFGWKKELKGNSTGTSTRQIASSKESHGKCCSPLGANRQLGRARGVPCLYPRALQSESLAHPRLKLSIQVHEPPATCHVRMGGPMRCFTVIYRSSIFHSVHKPLTVTRLPQWNTYLPRHLAPALPQSSRSNSLSSESESLHDAVRLWLAPCRQPSHRYLCISHLKL